MQQEEGEHSHLENAHFLWEDANMLDAQMITGITAHVKLIDHKMILHFAQIIRKEVAQLISEVVIKTI